MDSQSIISRAFWILFTLETAGWVFLMFWTPRGSRGPEGPVGGWLIYVVPPIMLGVPLLVVLIGRSKGAAAVGLAMISWPILAAIIGPIYSVAQNFWTERSVAGDLNFLRPSQRKLAHAVKAHNVGLVKTLLPNAGDLNANHGDESLFSFAFTYVDTSAASAEIIKAMLEHGANPNLVTPNRCPVLTFAIGKGPAITKLMLDAGADPNKLNSDMPAWWDVLYQTTPDGLQSLTMLLDHGANLTLRDSNGGCVGRAAGLKNWPAVWLLMERGAAWKGELAFGTPLLRLLEIERETDRHAEFTEVMNKIRARLETEPAPQ